MGFCLCIGLQMYNEALDTNDVLTKTGIKDDPRCSFCKEEPERRVHLFWSCSETCFVWKSTTRLKLYTIITENYSTTENIVALGLRPDSSKHLLARHFICLICKSKELFPRMTGFFRHVKSIYDIEIKQGSVVPNNWSLLDSF